ncbi:hypothetical protein Ahy_A09g044385 [Arachis hypogaea]|uniref:Ubiquitin-like protease family profile domain-containing protein n=1 Tax=Arachis hypogaea TaxID=3818 RepID=A0A445BK74_ARAHY|nr:hypothetical protein Ahy_A09g044385 [Arachis hypogaea]
MAIGNHLDGEFLQPKSKKLFNVEDYPSFIPFLDQKKLASHPYIFAPVCYSDHWWMWVADVRKKKFYILDPYHKTCPSKARMKLNKFIGYVISRIRVYAQDTSQEKKSYECAVYVMKWLEIIEPQTVNKGKYEWDNWTQVDHFRVEFASRILFHDINRDRDAAIKGSETMRLSKPSAALLSPYCQVDSYDIDSDSD